MRASEAFYEHETAWLATKALLYGSIVLGAVIAVAVVCLLLARRRRGEAAFWALSIAGVLVLDPLLKGIFARPGIGSAADDYSFPSGNAMAVVALVAAGVVLLRGRTIRRAAVLAGAAVVLVESAGLVLLGWHYASDVVAGWCVAIAWVTGLWLLLMRPGAHEPG